MPSRPQLPPGRLPRPAASHASGWRRWLPGLEVLRRYERAWLPHDLLAGLTLTAFLVPVGVAYAQASGLPAIAGLYASTVPLVAYALFGPSRILVLGPDSSLAAVTLAVVVPLSSQDPKRAAALGAMMALVSGVVCILAGMLKLGFITELISKPIRYGYMNGIALTVLISQLPKLLGVSIESGGPLRDLVRVGREVAEGRANHAALLIGAGVMTTMVVFKRLPRVPGILIAIVGAMLAVDVFHLAESSGLKVLGPLPQGLPSLALPAIGLADLPRVVTGGIAVAFIAFADTSVLSRLYAAKANVHIDRNQEVLGLGVANLAAGLFQGMPVSSSSSRTPVAEAAGARTQITGVVGAAAVGALLVAAPNLMRNLPASALAAVVIVSASGLFELSDLRRIFRIQQWEFWLSVVCLAGVVVFGPIPGIGLAIVAAVIEFLWDGWRPYSAVLGRVDGLRGYHDVSRHPGARLVPGLVLFRWDAPLFFANAELFQLRVTDAVLSSPTPVRRVVVTAEPVTSVDVTSADMLRELAHTLRSASIELRFAEVKDPVKDKLKRFELFDVLGADAFYPTVGAAVDAYVADHHVDWHD